MRRELIESYYEEYQRELERFLESDPEMFSLEAEILVIYCYDAFKSFL